MLCPKCSEPADTEFHGDLYCEQCAIELADTFSNIDEWLTGDDAGSDLKRNANSGRREMDYYGTHPWVMGG